MHGVLGRIILTDFEMKMGSGNSTGAAHLGNLFAARHPLALAHQIGLIMRVNRNDAALMTDDRVQLQQVILNLIMNAIEAMSESSEGPRELLILPGRRCRFRHESSRRAVRILN